MVVRQFDVFLVALDPTIGSEIRKTRPCVVISPNEMNRFLRTVIVAPMTTKSREYPFRIPCKFAGKPGLVVLDQIRAVDGSRLLKRLGRVPVKVAREVSDVIAEMFGA